MTEIPRMAKEVVFVADDLGMSEEINDAIAHAHRAGRLDGAALMMGQPGTAHAVSLAHGLPSLLIGWHLHLTDSQPLTAERWPWGASPARAGWAIGLLPAARRLMEAEVARQWELFQATGLPCAFVNSHHHLHAHPFVYRAVRRVVGETFPGWLRGGCPRFFPPTGPGAAALALSDRLFFARRRRLSPWRTTDSLWGLDRLFRMDAGEVRSAVATIPDGFHEFMFHPRTRTCPDTLCLLALKSPPLS
jgi:predicted glycoside hydrolase/deacetylase ChbG (UPF0249 family)